jgi:16S rRNA C967 or C1407 C5-methylase (RsmB/RsmF family)/NOL1/NOP2/fmu family ribosome biogenesis protein
VLTKYNNLFQQLPAALIDSLQTAKGFDEQSFIQAHEEAEKVVSVRLNPAKAFLNNPYSSFEKVAWSSTGYYLPTRPSFTSDPAFHAGAYYVQEASSMFVEEVIKQTCDLTKNLKVLDLCAAPGGKSILIQSLINDESLLVSNEVIKSRANVLVENIIRSGAPNVVITNNDPRDFESVQEFFDVIVVDAPCSGSGLFRKDPKAINEWSLQNAEHCSLRQQRILADIFSSLKPAGILIYSTCSYSECENEEIVDWIISDKLFKAMSLEIKKDWGIIESTTGSGGFGYRFYPDKVKGEGFFIAAFQKAGIDNGKNDIIKSKYSPLSQHELNIIKPFINPGLPIQYISWKDDVLALPAGVYKNLELLKGNLYLKKAGTNIGSIVRDGFLPSHELAVSTILSKNIPFIEIDKATALEYLRRHELKIETELKGWVLLKYNQLPIGWIKILANRINNYYPKEWRILNK